MSEPAPPGFANDAPVRAAPALTPEAIRQALDDFQAWLTTASQEIGVETEPRSVTEPVDLHTLLGQFIALRHEVNLQTRATRAQQEQNAETLRQLTAALEVLEALPTTPPPTDNGDEATQPLLKTLVDLHDALTVGGREIGRVQETVAPLLQKIAELTAPFPVDPALLIPRTNAPAPTPSPWQRWFGTVTPAANQGANNAAAEALAMLHAQQLDRTPRVQEQLDRLGAMIASLATGYTMSLQRIERALQKHDLEPMQVVGTAFDPERMEVVDIATNSGRPAGEVVEEVRRGYLQAGRVFRYAQVRVAKG